ncbi:MAG TPA: M20/M25/M40 family metallo-hydrolase [Vicinamibacterales bacterium]|nr:M20/M25/M40 family metallo-hydrolase [Vicinamibacterales bacterium]
MRMKIGLVLVATIAIAGTIVPAQTPRPLDVEYREVAGRLIGAALVDTGGWQKLTYLTTRIGNRLSGSPGLERAIAWTAEQMKADGLENVRTEPVKVPYWVRGRESARVVEPVQRNLNMLGLGGSVATPPEGLTAPVVVVGSFDELEQLGPDKVKGRIVVYDVPWKGYGQTVQYRSGGASRAAKLGAVAALVRSMTGHSLYTPHTGGMNYNPAVPEKIPTAAITVEDAAWLRQMTAMGQEVKVQLVMEAETRPDADSANVMGEIVGREFPDEVVVLGGHIDSWDVGQGAQDDGSGMMAAWQAVALMKQLGLKPRRTVRAVAWVNEENGGRGGRAYREGLGATVGRHVAAIEMDGGAEQPVGFGFSITGAASDSPRVTAGLASLRAVARLLEAIGANTIEPGGGGADIQPLMRDGVPGLGLRTIGEHYFDWHHTNADTLDKVDPQDFRRCIATLSVMAYVLADMPGKL